MARNFIPLVPSGTIGADADVSQLEQDVLAMDSRVGELAEDVGTIEQWDAGDIPFDSTETYASGSVGADLANVKNQLNEVQPEVLAMYPQKQITNAAVASFSDGADGVPVKSLTVGIEPVQDLHGYDNPWPAGGGKNLAKLSASTAGSNQKSTVTYSDTGATVTATGTYGRYGWLIPVEIGTTYTVSLDAVASEDKGTGYNNIIVFCDRDAVWNTTEEGYLGGGSVYKASATLTKTFTATTNVLFIGAYLTSTGTSETMTLSNVMLEVGSSKTTFAPYSNICPISGHTGSNVTVAGKNLLDPNSFETGVIGIVVGDDIDKVTASTRYIHSAIYKARGGLAFSIKSKDLSKINYYTVNMYVRRVLSARYTHDITAANATETYIVPANTYDYVRINIGAPSGTNADISNCDVQLEVGSSASAYEPYQGQTLTIDLDGTRYGGTLDVTNGVLTVTHASVDMDDLTWAYIADWHGTPAFYSSQVDTGLGVDDALKIMCSCYEAVTANELYYDTAGTSIIDFSSAQRFHVRDRRFSDAVAFKAALDGQTVVITLATPTVIELDPVSVTTINADNNIFADTGDIEELTYRADLSTILPANPSSDGTYVLKVTVASGVATYEWVEET